MKQINVKETMKLYKSLFCGFTLLYMLSTGALLSAQVILPAYPDSLFPTYFHQRVSLFNALPNTKDDVIFFGNSITDGGEWSELFNDLKVKNRGINGDVTAGILNRLMEVYSRKPTKVFLLIRTNDLVRNISPDSELKNMLSIVTLLKEKSPATRLFVQSIFPVNEKFGKFEGHTNKKSNFAGK